jgi:hypothetical protein
MAQSKGGVGQLGIVSPNAPRLIGQELQVSGIKTSFEVGLIHSSYLVRT